MRHFITFIFLFVLAFAYGQKDPSAEVYLDKIAHDLEPGHALNIKFDYTREDLQSGTELSGEGILVLMDEKYKIDLGEAIVYFDGEKQYSLQTEIEEVYISKPDSSNKEFFFSDPIRLLRTYKNDFKYRLIGEANFKNTEVFEVQLYPVELGGPYALIKLYIGQKNSLLNAIVIRHKDGILYTMIVNSFDRIEDPGNDFFQFNQEDYPDFDVIELMN